MDLKYSLVTREQLESGETLRFVLQIVLGFFCGFVLFFVGFLFKVFIVVDCKTKVLRKSILLEGRKCFI